jgi:hypothetical protein
MSVLLIESIWLRKAIAFSFTALVIVPVFPNTPVTPDDRISPIAIFSGRFIAGGCWTSWMKQTARRASNLEGAPGRPN